LLGDGAGTSEGGSTDADGEAEATTDGAGAGEEAGGADAAAVGPEAGGAEAEAPQAAIATPTSPSAIRRAR
jgi:hypothetical protein